MEQFSTTESVRHYVWQQRSQGKSVGVVPTMGALHRGHLSLVDRSREECDITIATVFVNPTQFGEGEDFGRYPRTLDEDLHALKSHGVDAVFVPETSAIYPDGFSTYVDPPEISLSLEGACRPGHFRGVTTIVLKLLLAIPATHAFFGRKDYQQWKVIEAMTRDLNVETKIVGCEIVRENDGLAMSSRNRYLSPEERERSLLLSRSLDAVGSMIESGVVDADLLQCKMRSTLLGEAGKGVDKIDYAVVVDADSLAPVDRVDRPVAALIAAHVGSTRLIDNTVISEKVSR